MINKNIINKNDNSYFFIQYKFFIVIYNYNYNYPKEYFFVRNIVILYGNKRGNIQYNNYYNEQYKNFQIYNFHK